MKYLINYGNRVVSVPARAMDAMQRASAADLKVLLALCASENRADAKKLSKLALCSEDEVKQALSFWRGVGLIDLCDGDAEVQEITESEDTKPAPEEKKPVAVQEKKKLRSADELPSYSTEELANVLEERQETAMLVDECQNIWGKVFNVKEINVLIGLVDYLGLDCEYVMILLTYCVSIGKKSLHYVEKTAFALYDSGIVTGEQLSEELKRREAAQEIEGKIRSMFGIGDRAFTTKEKKFISSWVNDMGYSAEIIQKAYEVTANATGKGALPYANSVLERWNAAGLRTLEDIEASYEKGAADKPEQGSFDTDSFFEAAVKRSLGDA